MPIASTSLPPARPSAAFKSPFCFGISDPGRAVRCEAMIDADVVVATCPSTFDRLSPSGSNPNPTDLDRLASSLNHLALRFREFGTDKSDEHLPLDAVA